MQKNYLNYYELLGVATNATTEEIEKAYKQKAKDYHPDKNGGHTSATVLFQFIQAAKDTLTESKKRLEYDYLAGVKKKPEPAPKIVKVPYPVKQTNKGDVAAALVGGAALGILAAIFFGGNSGKK